MSSRASVVPHADADAVTLVAAHRLAAALALYDAAAVGDACRVIHLLEGDAGVVGEKARDGMTALAVAAMNGHGGVVKVLLHYGGQLDAEQQPLLCLAIAGANANDDDGKYFGPGEAEAGDGVPVSFGRAEAGRADVVKQLIGRGASVEQPSSTGMTPLMLAALSGQASIVTALIAAKARPRRKTESGVTAMLAAAAGGHPDVISCLVRAGAGDDVYEAQNDTSWTPLHIAVMRRHCAAVGCLLEHDPYVDEQDAADKTPLLWAATVNHLGILDRLLDAGADASIADDDGCTPLMMAMDVQEGDIDDVIRHLIGSPQAQTFVNAANKAGLTALHLAAKDRNVELVEMLLDCGANPLAESNAHRLPIDMLGSDEVTKKAARDAGDGDDGQAAKAEDRRTLRGLLERAATAAELVEGSGLKDILQGISVVAVLLVTVTFVGVLNPPGGPTPDSGYVR